MGKSKNFLKFIDNDIIKNTIHKLATGSPLLFGSLNNLVNINDPDQYVGLPGANDLQLTGDVMVDTGNILEIVGLSTGQPELIGIGATLKTSGQFTSKIGGTAQLALTAAEEKDLAAIPKIFKQMRQLNRLTKKEIEIERQVGHSTEHRLNQLKRGIEASNRIAKNIAKLNREEVVELREIEGEIVATQALEQKESEAIIKDITQESNQVEDKLEEVKNTINPPSTFEELKERISELNDKSSAIELIKDNQTLYESLDPILRRRILQTVLNMN